MRTPGHDEELALGFLYGEGLINGPREAGPTDDLANNTILVSGPLTRTPGTRNFYTTSSCGVCGKGAIEEVTVHSERLRRLAARATRSRAARRTARPADAARICPHRRPTRDRTV